VIEPGDLEDDDRDDFADAACGGEDCNDLDFATGPEALEVCDSRDNDCDGTVDDGSVEMKTWEEADNRLLSRIKHARQSGVPIVELDEASQSPVPGRLVGQWGAGNWSGSEDAKLRTVRAGAAIQSRNGKRFLIYAMFSTATPSAMARVFQAYDCRYAMMLDMNALEHTYLAVYRNAGSGLAIDHLLEGMSVLDKPSAGQPVPRFVGFPDNRDFFYVMQRDVKGVQP